MKAPARLPTGAPFFAVGPEGRIYRQIDDELLDAFELDCRAGTVSMASIGMLVARIREAEKDRDEAEKIVSNYDALSERDIAEEREACARVAESGGCSEEIAATIRARKDDE